MENKAKLQFENVGMELQEDYVYPRPPRSPGSRRGSMNVDDNAGSEKGIRSFGALNVSELRVDELDFERPPMRSTPKISRSRRSSYNGPTEISRSRRSSYNATNETCPEDDIPPYTLEDGKEKPEDQKEDSNSLFSRRMTIAGGFLDVALFTSNCEQIKSIMEIKEVHMHYELVLGLLITSMILQAACGLTLFMVGCFVIRNPRDQKRVEILNHITIGIIVLITAVNIFISSFTVKGEVLNRCYKCLKRND